VLSSVLDRPAGYEAGPAVLAASPLHWGPLLQQRHPSSVFAGVAVLLARPTTATAPVGAISSPQRRTAAAVDRVVEVQGHLLALAAEALGTAIQPGQSFMEVRGGVQAGWLAVPVERLQQE